MDICAAIIKLYRFHRPFVDLSGVFVEIHADEEYFLAGVHIAAVIVAVFDLIHCDFRRLIKFELKHKNIVIIRGNSVNPAVVRFGFRRNADAKQHEDREEKQPEIVFVLHVDVVGDLGEKHLHCFHEAVHVARRDRIREDVHGIFDLIDLQAAAMSGKVCFKSAFDFKIRETKLIGNIPITLRRAFNGQIARLQKQRQGVHVVDLVCVESKTGNWRIQHGFQIETLFGDEFQQKRRCSGREPVIVELPARFKKHSQRNRIVDGLGCFLETVSVIPCFDLILELVYVAVSGKHRDTVAEIRFQFILGIAEHTGIPGIHRDIGQVVQVGEDRDMGEFADAGNKYETFHAVTGLDRRIKLFQDGQDVRKLRGHCVVQNRLVVLVDEDHDGILNVEIAD